MENQFKTGGKEGKQPTPLDISEGKQDLLLHPQNKKPITLVLEAGGYKLYEFENQLDLPIVRWERAGIMAEEFSRGITRGGLSEFIAEIKKALNPLEGEVVDLDLAVKLLHELEYRNDYLYDIELLFQMLSVNLFTLEEDVCSYDVDFGQRKIEIFKSLPDGFENDFFFTRSVSALLPADTLSNDIPSFLLANQTMMKEYQQKMKTLKQRSPSR